jgi:mono/diheme cytochrome c family protein
MEDMIMRFAPVIVAATGLMATIACAHAQDTGDIRAGRALAQRVCSECHAIGRSGGTSPNAYAPSFVTIASTPGMTGAALNFVLHNYHRRMPNLIFSDRQARAAIAYILSLKP